MFIGPFKCGRECVSKHSLSQQPLCGYPNFMLHTYYSQWSKAAAPGHLPLGGRATSTGKFECVYMWDIEISGMNYEEVDTVLCMQILWKLCSQSNTCPRINANNWRRHMRGHKTGPTVSIHFATGHKFSNYEILNATTHIATMAISRALFAPHIIIIRWHW